jgi:hypothetical protein
MEQRISNHAPGIADLLRRAEELEKRHSELVQQAEQALKLTGRAHKVFLKDGYEYVTKNGKRYRIRYRSVRPRRSVERSMRIIGGRAQYYLSADHFFSVVEDEAAPPDQLVVVPMLESVFELYQARTGRSLVEDEEVRIELCLDRIEEALDRGIDLLEVSKGSIEPLESPLVVTRQHLEEYLNRLER